MKGRKKVFWVSSHQPLLPWHLASWLRILCTILKGNTNTSDSDCRANTPKMLMTQQVEYKRRLWAPTLSLYSTRTLQTRRKKKHLLLKTFNTWNLIMYSATTCRVQCVTCSDTQDNQVNCVLTPTRQTQQMMSNLLLWCFNMQGSAVQSAVMFKGIFRCKFNPSNTPWHEIKFAGC